jgi:hypothetical protein
MWLPKNIISWDHKCRAGPQAGIIIGKLLLITILVLKVVGPCCRYGSLIKHSILMSKRYIKLLKFTVLLLDLKSRQS